MSALPYADFDGTYTVTEQELVDALQSAGMRGNNVVYSLPEIANAGGGSKTVPMPLSEYADTYAVTGDFVNKLVTALGPRGWSFMTAMQPYKA